MRGVDRLTVLLVVLAVACGERKTQLPKAAGQPYEVLVVGDSCGALAGALGTAECGLPQREPSFDVRCIGRDEFKGINKLFRNIVIVEPAANGSDSVGMETVSGRYARGQMLVRIKAALAAGKENNAAWKNMADSVVTLFRKAELARSVRLLRREHNKEMEQRIYRMFGIRMLVPSNLNACKAGKDFLWMADNSATGTQNICVYTLGGTGKMTLERLIEMRDSVMKANIKGETDSMFVKTSAQTVPQEEGSITRGLWEMEHDAMGGPFVMRHFVHSGRTVAVEAFIYAPGKKKRNLMRQTEASLYTIK